MIFNFTAIPNNDTFTNNYTDEMCDAKYHQASGYYVQNVTQDQPTVQME